MSTYAGTLHVSLEYHEHKCKHKYSFPVWSPCVTVGIVGRIFQKVPLLSQPDNMLGGGALGEILGIVGGILGGPSVQYGKRSKAYWGYIPNTPMGLVEL